MTGGGAIGSGGGGNGNGGGPYGSGGLYGQAPGSNGDGVSKTAVEVCRTCGAELAAPGAACPVCPSDEVPSWGAVAAHLGDHVDDEPGAEFCRWIPDYGSACG